MNSRVFESSSDVILIVDGQGFIINVSTSIERVFGYAKEELLGQKLSVLLPAKLRGHHDHMFQHYTADPSPRRMGSGRELKARRKDGSEFFVDVGLSHYTENDQRFYAAIIRDISDLKRAEIQLKEKNEQLERKNQELNQFAHIVSHDLKSPVNMLIQYMNIIGHEHSDELPEEVREYFTVIRERAYHIRNLVDGILDFSAATGGLNNSTEFQLSDVLNDIKESIAIPDHIKLELPPEDECMYGNKIHLYQVLSNLIRNAIKYHNKEQGMIKVLLKDEEEYYVFEVIDNGPGIPQSFQDSVFEMFTTVHRENRPDSSGIGLAIVKKLVDQNGGTVKLESEEGSGCRFTFSWKKALIPSN